MSLIEVKDLCFSYGYLEVLRNLNFELSKGEFLSIVGPNGAGKSTLINLLCGLLKVKKGTISIEQKPIEKYKTKDLAMRTAVVRQEFIPAFGFSVAETVMMARTAYYNQLGFDSPRDRMLVSEALEATDTYRFADRDLMELSGGERQRVFIARALAQDTDILLLDEPTSFLDLKHQVGIYDLLKKMQTEKQKSIVAITHDINIASQYCDKVLLLSGLDKYFWGRPEDIFTSQRLKEVFGVECFEGRIGEGKFFLPLGRLAKDAGYHKDKGS